MIDKEKGEFIFTMYQNELRKLQYVATYAGEKDEAVRGLHYSIKSISTSKRARKHQRNKLNKKTKGLSESGALGVNQIPNG